MSNKPNYYPEWASVIQTDPNAPGNILNVVEPPANKKQLGWVYGEFPPSNWLNWMLNSNYYWIKYFDAITGKPFINGLLTINNPATPTTNVIFGVGSCTDSTQSSVLANSVSFNKFITSVWAIGSGSGGRASACPLAVNTWYHHFIIGREDGTIDFGFDTNINAVNLLNDANAQGFVYFRRIGARPTLPASAVLDNVVQVGNEFYYVNHAQRLIFLSAWAANTKTIIALPTPLGVVTKAYLGYGLIGSNDIGGTGFSIEPMFVADYVVSNSNAKGKFGLDDGVNTPTRDYGVVDWVWTDLLSQVWYRIAADADGDDFAISTYGWIEYL